MLSIRCAQLLFTLWAFQCSTAQKSQTLLAVKDVNNQITIKSLPYSAKPEDIIIGKAKYTDGINSTGWGYLQIKTSSKATDADQAYGAGYLEGAITADLIYSHWHNMAKGYCTDRPDICKDLKYYMNTNKNWIESKLNDFDPYWYQVGLYYKQLDGLFNGYTYGKSSRTPNLTLDDLYWLNALDDLDDISVALNSSMVERKVLGSGSCSALIKLLPGNKDLLVSHATWSGYKTMLKIQKRYSLKFRESKTSRKLIGGSDMSFSSFPGGIQSGDDFYLMSSGLATLETTIDNHNKSLWSNVKPVGQIMEFVRAMIANRLARNPTDWIQLFKLYNSGTYNNQWMIVNYAAFQPGNPQLETKDLLHVLEQMPGYVVHDDLTSHLADQTYWASYNVPFFPFIFNISGSREMEKEFGEWFSYSGTPRARIFARDHNNVHCDKCLVHLMRSNDFKHDPESRCENCNPPYSAENAISARNDLNLVNGTYPIPAMRHRCHGATDVKVTSSELFKYLKFRAVAGPTQGANNSFGPFCWSKSDFNTVVSHLGQPDCFNFTTVTHEWIF